MKIGFVMMETIQPFRGGVHEQVHLLRRQLERRGVRADLLAYSRRAVEDRGKRMLWLRQLSPSFVAKLVRAEEDVYISETAWPILPTLISCRLNSSLCILHLHSLESKQDVGLGMGGRALIKGLEEVGKLCDLILVPSRVEASLLRSNRVRVLPNVIDVDSFTRSRPAELRRPAVTFVGGMGYPPNREAAEEVIRVAELVNRSMRVNFYLVGPSPPPAKPPVYATGYVDSTAPYVLGSDICVAPVRRGGGVKLKVLEYMASGKPIVATGKAVEGVEGIEFVRAETREEFAQSILDILEGRVERERFVVNVETVRREYSPENSVSRLLRIIS